MKALLNSLNETELAIIRETELARMVELDEDDLADLHDRVRRARTKYVKMYRREASAKVEEYGGRGKARPKNTRNAQKAEVFEDALARVSRRLAVIARQSAQALKAERLAASRRKLSGVPAGLPTSGSARQLKNQRSDRRPTSPELAKRHGSVTAKTAKRQARRDNRPSTD
jgi:hypothetical protein